MSFVVAKPARGMTLVEVTITLAILALATAVVIPALNNLTRADLKKSASQLGGTLRASYDAAALSGEQHRVVFEIGGRLVKVEKGSTPASGGAGLMGLAGLLAGGGGPSADEGEAAEPIEVQAPAEILSFFGVESLDDDEEKSAPVEGQGSSVAKFSATEHDLELDDDVKVMDVWLAGADKPINEGHATILFYPQGYTRGAIVHLVDSDNRVFSVKLRALTGKVEIVDSYVEPES